MTFGPDRKTVSRWIREEVAAGRMPRIRGGDGNDNSDTSKTVTKTPDTQDDTSEDDTKQGTKIDDNEDKDKKKTKPVTVEIEGVTYVVQDHVDKLVGDARTDGKNKGRTELEDELRNKQLQDQGNFKELYEKEQAKVASLQNQLDELKFAELKRTIGTKHGLSLKLIDRLKGTTEAELEADAKDLAKEFGKSEEGTEKKKSVRTESNNNRNRSTDGEKKPDEETKKKRRTYGFVQAGDVSRWG